MAKRIQEHMIVDELLTELLSAIAVGHAALVERSASPLGTLVVKSGEVSVAFDLSSEVHESKSGFGLGVRPTTPFTAGVELTQTGQKFDQTVSNRATVTLQIVNVLPQTLEPTVPPKPEPEPPAFDPAEALAILQKYLREHGPFFSPAVIAAFNAALADYQAGNLDEARRRFQPVLAEIRAGMHGLALPIDPAVKKALDRLTEWAGQGRRAARSLSSKDRASLALLEQLAGEMDLEAAARRKLAAGVQAALAAGSRAEAHARLAAVVIEIRPGLTGKVLPADFFDQLERLNLLELLNNPDPAWRAKLTKPMQALVGLVNALEIPPKTKSRFERDCQRAAASGSELEAGSRLFQAVQDLKRRTRELDLPEDVRKVLDGFEPKP